ncbi:MAG: peptidase [Flaviaesturariibacter sp.]|nr:peptidase [Flaviaesturariibacter sp.]
MHHYSHVPRTALLASALFFFSAATHAQLGAAKKEFTRADTLRGSVTPERAWWDVRRYDIQVSPDYNSRTITGSVILTYATLSKPATGRMQIDLQEPMILDSVFLLDGKRDQVPEKEVASAGMTPAVSGKAAAAIQRERLEFSRAGNLYYVETGTRQAGKEIHKIMMYFHGTPRRAVTPPWDGGWIWARDEKGRPWMSVACQGLGASVWYPCKDHQSDEPDQGASLTMTVPDSLVAVANGRLKHRSSVDGMASYAWEVVNPINNYTIIPYIGKYVHFADTLRGEKGKLDLDYWVLDYELEKAKEQFKQVKPMLRAFEYWFGPYPFYEDGYKLVQAPHLGMEHQSAVAYGNKFRNGYLGRDLSGTGQGLKWDYIIVHESGHEWFANNITTNDIADMWIHEGFTDYSETLFIEYHHGKEAANQYLQGLRKNIANDAPIIGPYGVNKEGSSDMYYKGANLLHTIRQIIGNDDTFRQILRGLNKDFYHQTVTSKQVEDYIAAKSGKKLSKIFDQYLRTKQVPVLELKTDDDKIKYRWTNVIEGFDMPVLLTDGTWLYPTTSEQKLKKDGLHATNLTVDPNFYVQVKKAD